MLAWTWCFPGVALDLAVSESQVQSHCSQQLAAPEMPLGAGNIQKYFTAFSWREMLLSTWGFGLGGLPGAFLRWGRPCCARRERLQAPVPFPAREACCPWRWPVQGSRHFCAHMRHPLGRTLRDASFWLHACFSITPRPLTAALVLFFFSLLCTGFEHLFYSTHGIWG